jgi:hypothetical protein
MASYKSGDTIRLLCTFKDFADQLADPELINVKIYDQKYLVIDTISVSTSSNKLSTGNFFLDYTVPSQYIGQTLYYEWYAEIGGLPSLNRNSFQVVFM